MTFKAITMGVRWSKEGIQGLSPEVQRCEYWVKARTTKAQREIRKHQQGLLWGNLDAEGGSK